MDKRVFTLGVAMLAIGGLSWFYFYNNQPAGKADMTDEETNALLQAQALNMSLQSLFGWVAGLGFFIVLISVGLKRRKKGETGKSITQKPTES